MEPIQQKRIFDCLAQLSNKEFQQKAWAAQLPGVMASLVEAIAGLYTDSGLENALGANEIVFSKTTDKALRELRNRLTAIYDIGYSAEAVDDPRMSEIRELAGNILSQMILLQNMPAGYLESLNS